ncbi:MAG: hypothetical protein ACYC91_13935 [Solirubrobacteraceae bacterium]
MSRVQNVWRFFRSNPQALVLLIVCLVLGIGTFLAVLFSIAGSAGNQASGEPSGSVQMLRALIDL